MNYDMESILGVVRSSCNQTPVYYSFYYLHADTTYDMECRFIFTTWNDQSCSSSVGFLPIWNRLDRDNTYDQCRYVNLL